MEENLCSGMLYKRRGGFGKIMPNNWQFRYFVLSKEGLLQYYDTESSDTTIAPRGKIDLKNINFEFYSCELVVENAPHQFFMQITPANDEKWKLCAGSKEDQIRWSSIFEKIAIERSNSNPNSPTSPAESRRQSVSAPIEDSASTDRNSISSGTSFSTLSLPKFRLSSRMTSIAQQIVENSPADRDQEKTEQKISNENDVIQPIVQPVVQQVVQPVESAKTVHKATKNEKRRGLKLNNSNSSFLPTETIEFASALIIMNFCFFMAYGATSFFARCFYIILPNIVIGHTMSLRALRNHAVAVDKPAAAVGTEAALSGNDKAAAIDSHTPLSAKDTATSSDSAQTLSDSHIFPIAESSEQEADDSVGVARPAAGSTLSQSLLPPAACPPHTWCVCDHAQFFTRIGPDYNRFKKKAASPPPLYRPFAVDVFCTKLRQDHACQRFAIPEELLSVDTNHSSVPPVFVVQIQIPSDPPPSFFSSVEDGPGWAILMYFKITEETIAQLKDLSTASPAVRLFADWCAKAPSDSAVRGRFKVINSCTNLEELGMPQAIINYNAKPVLIRRTGTLFTGRGYIEKDIHVHKFANLAKQSIHLISSRCGKMFMQIGFVIEGRSDEELPEALFGCVAVNKPQEDQAEFLFDDDEAQA